MKHIVPMFTIMKTKTSGRGFRYVLAEKYQNEPGEYTRLLAESSAIGDYEDAFDNPGGSYLWVGSDHHLSREEIADMIEVMQHWLDHKRLPE